MESIQQQAIHTFQENLSYLREVHPNVFKKVDILNHAIENGSYKEKYSLEYKNGYFDVLDLQTNHYLYNQSSIEHAKTLTKQVNFKKSSSVIESFYKQHLTQEDVDRYDSKPPKLDPLFAAAKIIYYANSVSSENDEMKYIQKYIFCGVGLGLHIPPIQNKTKSQQLFIIEDNLELFRLSLFTTDYKKLSTKAKLYFSIMDDEFDFKNSINSFYATGYNNNHYLKYSIFSQSDLPKTKKIQRFIVSNGVLSYPYSDTLRSNLKSPEYLVEGYPFIDFSSIHKNSPFSEKPLLYLAAGPSLDSNSRWIQENKDKFYIISVLAAVKTLFKLDVKPDIVIHIDDKAISVNFLDGVDRKSFLDKTVFIFSSTVSRNVLESFEKENVFFFDKSSSYKIDYGVFPSVSVGETSYAISLLLGAKELYMLGLDLALDPQTKRSHAEGHMSSSIINQKEDEDYLHLHTSLLYVKGNFLETVPTTTTLSLSIPCFNDFSDKYLINNQKVYNLSNGAYLKGTIPLKAEDVDTVHFSTLTRQKKFESIKIFLKEISQCGVNEKDKKSLEEQLSEALRVKTHVLNFKKNASTSNYDLYMKSFYLLTLDIVNEKSTKEYAINTVIYRYLPLVSSYIFNIFNTKNLKNSKRHLKKVHDIFCEQVIKILDLYINTMSVYIKWIEK
ncbi:MAG: 6-hydroxymethylpterin diphosphokinase MptE-like protein [Sulfurimonas sp.]|uniref:motility associated factor glycosyltransferase family protein n=1 Tax=Sulfurimonas sp. TaxID=2022749 RepID=UPI003D101120